MLAAAAAAAAAPVSAVDPSQTPLVRLCQHVWSLATPDADSMLDGMQMRPLMLMSQLPAQVLGQVWALVDTAQIGKVGLMTCPLCLVLARAAHSFAAQIDYRQLGFLLGLMGQAQRNEPLDRAAIGALTAPPVLHGLKPYE